VQQAELGLQAKVGLLPKVRSKQGGRSSDIGCWRWRRRDRSARRNGGMQTRLGVHHW